MGYRLMTTEDPKTEIEAPQTGTPAPAANARWWTLRRISGLVAALAAVGTVLAGLTGYWTTYRTITRELLAPVKPGPIAPAEAARFSIVVLPFSNLSDDPRQDYFADAITENLTTGMSRYKLPVIARNTAFTYKGKNIDAKEIGKDLGVRYVLEGSVQRDRNRVRVNAQLIDAHSGTHLWADQFDTTRADLLQTQDEIVARIASTVRYELTKAEAQKNAIAANPDVLDLTTRCVVSVLGKAGLFGKEAAASCERALDVDPNNVTGLSISSIGFTMPILLGRSTDPRADLKRADELASRAIAIDVNNPLGHLAKGNVLRVERHFDDAIAEFERGLALDPNLAEVPGTLGQIYVDIGQYEKAIEFFDKAIRLGPQNQQLAFWNAGKGFAYFGMQEYDQAIEWARRAIAINPNFESPLFILGAALALSGHEAEARDAEQRRVALSKVKNFAMFFAVFKAFMPPPSADPRARATFDRIIEGLRMAGMPEE
jgi:adenylate cyclase